MCSQASIKSEKTKNASIYFKAKRLIDCIMSLIGIILLIPVFIIIGFLIKIDSK